MVEQQANPPTAHTYIYLFIYTHTRRDCVDNDDGGWSVNKIFNAQKYT